MTKNTIVPSFDYNKQSDWHQESIHLQSPINLCPQSTKKWRGESAKIKLNFTSTVNIVEDTGHTVQVSSPGHALISGRHYELKQFHFHAESEHTIDGVKYPIEAHFVYETFNGSLAVIAVFMDEGANNETFGQLLDHVDDAEGIYDINLYNLIPENLSYFHYMGSLTTPPLTENVEWYVMKHPVEISKEQIEHFRKIHADNYRHVQPINDRSIIEYIE